MRLNKYQYLENKETYLLIVFFIFAVKDLELKGLDILTKVLFSKKGCKT